MIFLYYYIHNDVYIDDMKEKEQKIDSNKRNSIIIIIFYLSYHLPVHHYIYNNVQKHITPKSNSNCGGRNFDVVQAQYKNGC